MADLLSQWYLVSNPKHKLHVLVPDLVWRYVEHYDLQLSESIRHSVILCNIVLYLD